MHHGLQILQTIAGVVPPPGEQDAAHSAAVAVFTGAFGVSPGADALPKRDDNPDEPYVPHLTLRQGAGVVRGDFFQVCPVTGHCLQGGGQVAHGEHCFDRVAVGLHDARIRIGLEQRRQVPPMIGRLQQPALAGPLPVEQLHQGRLLLWWPGKPIEQEFALQCIAGAADLVNLATGIHPGYGHPVLGEGAGVMVLEEYEHARARGAKIYSELCGFGMSGDAYHMTAPNMDGPRRCMNNALRDAGLNADQIQYVNAHGTSTPLGDKNETEAIKAALGDHAKKVVVNSTKSMTGHLLGGAGGLESVFTVLALHHQKSPPTINIFNQDPECDLDYCANAARDLKISYAVKNNFGFGGTNGTLIFGNTP